MWSETILGSRKRIACEFRLEHRHPFAAPKSSQWPLLTPPFTPFMIEYRSVCSAQALFLSNDKALRAEFFDRNTSRPALGPMLRETSGSLTNR